MKNIMTFSTIVAVHVVAFVMIAIQPACTSKDGAKRPPERGNTSVAKRYNENTEVILPEKEIPEGSASLRAAPSRPTFTLNDKKSKGDILVNNENQAPNEGLLMPTSLDEKVEVESVMQSSAMPQSYVVKAGDNLTKIAKANKTTVTAIKDLNNIKSNNIYVGQKLKMPKPSQAPTPSAETSPAEKSTTETSGEVYVVKTGDSLSKIAVQNGTTVSAIKDLNNISSDTIFIGQKLKMPKASAKSSTTSTKPAVNDNYDTYTVKRGDYLGAIALNNKISLAQLQKLNPSVNPNKLQVGQVLVIREKALSPTVANDAPATREEKAVDTAPIQAPKVTPIQLEPTPMQAPEPKPVELEEITIINI